MKILVVDDNRELACFLQAILEESGYQAYVAYDGQSAIDLFQRECFDLALLDYKLPDMDGLTLQERLSEATDADFIIITAYGSVKSASEAVTRRRIVGYESKPLDMDRLMAFIRQITQRREAERIRKQAEASLKKKNEELAQERRRIDYILDVTRTGIYIVDARYNLRYANSAWRNLYGDPSGKKCFEYIRGRARACDDCDVRDSLEQRQTIVSERILRREDNHVVQVHTIPFRDSNIEWLAALLIVDITDRKRAEKALLQAEKAESLNRMAGAVAHIFNNQLYAVLGNLDMVLEDLPFGEAAHECTLEAIQAANKSAEISGMMLTCLGHNADKAEAVDLSDVCRRHIPKLRGIAPDTIALKSNFMKSGPIIHASTRGMLQILTHLTTNAAEAHGNSHGEITLATKVLTAAQIPNIRLFPPGWRPTTDQYACLEVSDSGCGIDEPDMDKIFDPFYTTKFIGRGLGLPLVIGIVSHWQAAVGVQSTKGEGAIVSIFFPLAREFAANSNKEDKPYLKSNRLICDAC